MRPLIVVLVFIVSFVMIAPRAANATPIVTYTYTGSPGDYTLDFTVQNTIPDGYGQEIYFFGVDLTLDTQEPAAGWIDYGFGTWTNVSFGGSAIIYETLWMAIAARTGENTIKSGDSLSGFRVGVDTIPTEVYFFLFADHGLDYLLDDAFFKGDNPGWEGVAALAGLEGPASVPEPATLSLLGIGLVGLVGGAARKKFKKKAIAKT